MNKLRFLLMATVLTMVLAMAGAVNAFVPQTIDESSDSIFAGVVELNITVDGGNYSLGANNNITNVTFWRVNGSTEYFIGNNDSNTLNGTISTWKMNFDTSSLADGVGANYNITYRIYNGTQPHGGSDPNYIRRNETSISGIRIDNTVPTITVTTAAATIFDADTTTIRATVRNYTGSTCAWIFGGNRFTGTIASDICTFVLQEDKPSDADYQVRAELTDGLNQTSTSDINFGVDFNKRGNKASIPVGSAAQQVVQKIKSNQIASVAVIVIAIVLLSRQGGRRKK